MRMSLTSTASFPDCAILANVNIPLFYIIANRTDTAERTVQDCIAPSSTCGSLHCRPAQQALQPMLIYGSTPAMGLEPTYIVSNIL